MNPSAPDIARLDASRRRGDPLADAVIAKIFASGNVEAVNGLLSGLLRNGQLPPAGLDPAMNLFLEESEQPARRADRAVMLRAENFFAEHGPSCLSGLFFASLPECYVARGIARVLGLSGRLKYGAQRRVYETAQMVVDVLSPGGLDPDGDGRGIRAAQRVRLMHAAMRHLVSSAPIPRSSSAAGPALGSVLRDHAWDSQLGVPINQEDLAYTLLTFSHVVPRSLKLLGIKISAGDADAYLATWNVVGRIMGVEEELLPATPEDAASWFETMKARQAEATPDAALLMTALLDAAKTIGVAKLDPDLPEAMARHLLDKHTRALVGMGHHLSLGVLLTKGLVELVQLAGASVSHVIDDFKIGREVGVKVGLHVVKGLVNLPPAWERDLFRIPASLTTQWGASVATSPAGAQPPSPGRGGEPDMPPRAT